jgi:hypothetical protein
MSKARDIADLGSNDVLDTSSSGIDVTGSVTADGLTVDSSGADITLSGGRTVINTDSPSGNGLVINGIGTPANYYFDIRDDNVRGILTVDGSGNLLVGTTSTGIATTSTETGTLISDGGISIAANNPVAQFNRITSVGTIVNFRQAGAIAGSVGFQPDGFYIDGEANHSGLRFGSGGIVPRYNGADIDADIGLGNTTSRFQDLYLSGGVKSSGGDNIFNEDGGDNDFRVESDTYSHALFVDASTGRVGINASSPVAELGVGDQSGSGLHYIDGTANQVEGNTNGLFVSYNTADNSDLGYGLRLVNNNNTNGAKSPLIAFSALSASNSFNHTYAYISGYKISNGADTNWNKGGIQFATGNGTGPHTRMSLDNLGGLTLSPTDNGHTVFNEGSGDCDFRVESNDSAHMLYVDGGDNYVSIRRSTQQGDAALTVGGDGIYAERSMTTAHATMALLGNSTTSWTTEWLLLQRVSPEPPIHVRGYYYFASYTHGNMGRIEFYVPYGSSTPGVSNFYETQIMGGVRLRIQKVTYAGEDWWALKKDGSNGGNITFSGILVGTAAPHSMPVVTSGISNETTYATA